MNRMPLDPAASISNLSYPASGREELLKGDISVVADMVKKNGGDGISINGPELVLGVGEGDDKQYVPLSDTRFSAHVTGNFLDIMASGMSEDGTTYRGRHVIDIRQGVSIGSGYSMETTDGVFLINQNFFHKEAFLPKFILDFLASHSGGFDQNGR